MSTPEAPTPRSRAFSIALKDAFDASHLQRKWVVAVLPFSPRTFDHFMKGDNIPSVTQAWAMADLFGVEMASLYARTLELVAIEDALDAELLASDVSQEQRDDIRRGRTGEIPE